MGRSTLLLVRHGETAWNKDGVLQGQRDVPLSARGIEQAGEAAPFFRTYAPTEIWVSPLQRARKTLEILSVGMTADPIVEPRLMERNWGVLEGTADRDLPSRFPEVMEKLRRDRIHAPVPEGESMEAFWDRIGSVWELLRQRQGRVAVVSHGGTIRALLGIVLGVPPDQAPRLVIDNVHMTFLDLQDGGATIRAVNIWSPLL